MSLPFPSSQKGFSLLEVLITAAIIGVITGIVTLRYGSFNNLILLKNQAYQVALDLRETQTRSLSVTGEGAEFRRPYGIYFSTAQPDRYTVFRDSDEDGLYDAGEELEIRRVDSRFRVSELCVGSNCGLNTLAVTFRRPNFDAILNGVNGAADGKIKLVTTSADSTRVVNVNAAGQITVD